MDLDRSRPVSDGRVVFLMARDGRGFCRPKRAKNIIQGYVVGSDLW